MAKYTNALTKLKYCDEKDACSEKVLALSNIGKLQ